MVLEKIFLIGQSQTRTSYMEAMEILHRLSGFRGED
jgi:hypothetical protein